MKEELIELYLGMIEYFTKSIVYANPILVFITASISYLLFPNDSYISPAIGLMIALGLDIISKYYSVSVLNGGFINSIKTKKLTSESLWSGSKKKLISILTIMLLCGLAIRFTPIFPQISAGIAAIAYTIMLYRELQSVLENLIDAGHDDLKWFLFFIKKKKKDIMDANGIKEEDNNSNNSPNE